MNARRSFAFAAALSAALGLAACSTMDSAPPPPSSVMQLQAELSAKNEVPANASGGTGHADVQYDRATGMLSWRVTYTGLTGPATAAHIHGPAAANANAGVKVPFAMSPSPITGQAKISPADAGDLLAGLWYVNVHTAANPGGEIRGQLMLKR